MVHDGKKYAEFIFNRRFAVLLSQMAVSHPVKDGGQSCDDMPVFHAPQMEAVEGVQAHRKGVFWSVMSDKPKFDVVLDLVGRMNFTQIHSVMIYIGIIVEPNNRAEVLKCNIYIIDLEVEVEMSLTSMDRDKKQNTVVGILVNARVANSIQHQLTILGNTLAEPRRTPTFLNIVDIAILYTLELRDICPSIIS